MEPLVTPDGGEAAASVGPHGAHAAPSRTIVPMGATPWADQDLCAKSLLLGKQTAFLPRAAEHSAEALQDFGSLREVAEVFFTAEHDLL